MTVKRLAGKSAIVIWLLVELVLLIVIESIVNLDHARLLSDVQYAAIVCNTIMTYLFFRAYGTRPENAGEQLMACGLFATAAADFFMTFLSTGNTDPIYNTGVLLFCVVQLIYMQYIKPDKRMIATDVILIVFFCSLFAHVDALKLDITNVLRIIDVVLVLVNAIWANIFRKDKVSGLFRAGIALFFLCDMTIGIRGALPLGTLHDDIALLVWLFYVPAQVCLTLSYIRSLEKSRAESG